MGADRVKEARLQTLMADFNRLKMKETDSIDNFVGRLSELSTKSATLGESNDELKLVKKFLNSLPRIKYIHIIAALEKVLDLNKTSFEDIVGRLKAYEERIFDEEDEKHEDQSQNNKLMYTNADSQPYQERYESGREEVWVSGKRQRTLWLSAEWNYHQERDALRVTCFRCDKLGHFAQSFPDRLLKLQETQESEEDTTHDADELMMNEVVYLNERNVVPSKIDAASTIGCLINT